MIPCNSSDVHLPFEHIPPQEMHWATRAETVMNTRLQENYFDDYDRTVVRYRKDGRPWIIRPGARMTEEQWHQQSHSLEHISKYGNMTYYQWEWWCSRMDYAALNLHDLDIDAENARH